MTLSDTASFFHSNERKPLSVCSIVLKLTCCPTEHYTASTFMDELNDQIEQRIKKLDRLRSLGIDPFGGKFNVKDSAPDVIARYTQATTEALASTPVLVTLAGRVTALRRFGKAAFASIQDGPAWVQVYLKKDVLGEPGFALAELLDIADWIGVSGPLFRTKTNELTVEVQQ